MENENSIQANCDPADQNYITAHQKTMKSILQQQDAAIETLNNLNAEISILQRTKIELEKQISSRTETLDQLNEKIHLSKKDLNFLDTKKQKIEELSAETEFRHKQPGGDDLFRSHPINVFEPTAYSFIPHQMYAQDQDPTTFTEPSQDGLGLYGMPFNVVQLQEITTSTLEKPNHELFQEFLSKSSEQSFPWPPNDGNMYVSAKDGDPFSTVRPGAYRAMNGYYGYLNDGRIIQNMTYDKHNYAVIYPEQQASTKNALYNIFKNQDQISIKLRVGEQVTPISLTANPCKFFCTAGHQIYDWTGKKQADIKLHNPHNLSSGQNPGR